LLLACAVIETVRLQQKLWKQSGSDSMVRSHKRLLALLGMLLVLVLLTTVLYMAGMSYLEGKPRGFWDALEWAGESLSTTGYGRDSNWSHPLMVSYVVLVQFVGVFLVFLVFPIYLIPFFEERFETRLPKEIPGLKNHVVIFDYGPPVATLLNELEQASIATVVVEEDEGRRPPSARARPSGNSRQPGRRRAPENSSRSGARTHCQQHRRSQRGDDPHGAPARFQGRDSCARRRSLSSRADYSRRRQRRVHSHAMCSVPRSPRARVER
jgi:hypothetical protein